MRVNKAKNLLSHKVSTALEFLANEYSKPEWYTIMTSRHCCISLGTKDLEKYKDTVSFLNEII